MSTNDSLQFFLRLLKQKHNAVQIGINKFLGELVGNDPKAKKQAAETLIKTANELRAILSKNDIPQWLPSIIAHLSNYASGSSAPQDLVRGFLPLKAAIEEHVWSFEQSSEASFDFDSIFEHYKKESSLPQLFDEIVTLLEEIQNSGAVDSVMMLRALGKLIATIKRSKDGSYFSMNSAWDFLLNFINNYLFAELSKIPVLGTVLEALEKTIRQADAEMCSLHTNLRNELIRVAGEDVQAFSRNASFPFLTYNESGKLQAHKPTPQLPNVIT